MTINSRICRVSSFPSPFPPPPHGCVRRAGVIGDAEGVSRFQCRFLDEGGKRTKAKLSANPFVENLSAGPFYFALYSLAAMIKRKARPVQTHAHARDTVFHPLDSPPREYFRFFFPSDICTKTANKKALSRSLAHMPCSSRGFA